jgi:hypothetical protein
MRTSDELIKDLMETYTHETMAVILLQLAQNHLCDIESYEPLNIIISDIGLELGEGMGE